MSSRLLETIKKVSESSLEAMKPADIFFGTVESESPLIIGIDQKLKLTEDVLILTSSVLDFKCSIVYEENKMSAYIEDFCELSGSCKIKTNPYEEEIVIKNSLKKGEKVILLRALGGQKFVVLDRVEV